MKKEKKVFEGVKQNTFHNLLAVIGGLILTWCIFWFIPMEGFFEFITGFVGKNITTVSLALYYSVLVALAIIVFAFGFFAIKSVLDLDLDKKKVKESKKESSEAKV